jgi:hypothetical protein
MSKNILDFVLGQKNLDSIEKENEVLKDLLTEINLISNEDIRSFVRSILLKCEGFWTVPASFSGKHHPQDERGQGGNLLHTKRVVRIALIVSESYGLVDEERDPILAACILHDITKGKFVPGDNPSYEYDPMHPYTVGSFVEKCRILDKEYSNDTVSSTLFVTEDVVQSILRLVRCHLGPWSPVPETYPITYMDYIVHLSDHIASKIHSIIEDSELINEKWRI